jgi:hypothetical protein
MSRVIATAIAGILLVGGALTSAQAPAPAAQGPVARRQVSIGGQRARVIDIHAHATVAEVGPVVLNTEYAKQGGGRPLGPDRVALIDKRWPPRRYSSRTWRRSSSRTR